MTYEEVKKEAFEIINAFARQRKLTAPTSETDNFDEFGFDSLHQIELIMKMEKHFEIHIDDISIEHISTVGDLIKCSFDLVNKKTTPTQSNTSGFETLKNTPDITPTKPVEQKQPIHMVRQNNQTIQFRRGNQTLSLNDPKISAILERIKQELEHLK